jgi:NADH-quinone oxidoreductase subunit E
MLSEQDKKELLTEAAKYEHRRSVVCDALLLVQRRYGYVSDEGVAAVAEFLGMTADEVDDVATAYSLIFRRPVGRHVILLCDSVSCCLTGYDELREHLKSRLGIVSGETTADGRFTLLPVACLGLCEQAPAMMIGDDVHGNLTPAKLDEILERYP